MRAREREKIQVSEKSHFIVRIKELYGSTQKRDALLKSLSSRIVDLNDTNHDAIIRDARLS